MVIEPLGAVRVVREVGEDVGVANLDSIVGDILRMYQVDRVDLLLARDDDGADEAIEICPGHKPHAVPPLLGAHPGAP